MRSPVLGDFQIAQITMPPAPAADARFIPFSIAAESGHSLVFISGQGTRLRGEFQFVGKVGREFSLEQGYQAAQICAANLLSQIYASCDGDFSKVVRVHKLNGYVNAAPDFIEISKVVNGASDLLIETLGAAGKHARTALGVATLPNGMAVEIEAVVEISVNGAGG